MWPRSSASGSQPSSSRASRSSAAQSSASSSSSYVSSAGPQAPYYAAPPPLTAPQSNYYVAVPAASQPLYPVAGTDPRLGAGPGQYPPNMMQQYANAQGHPSAPGPISEEAWRRFLETGFIPNPTYQQVTPAPLAPSSSGRPSSSRSSATIAQASYVPSSSQSGTRRGSELDDLWEEMNRYCRCPDRTQKPLRHWETVCPYNPNKQTYYCDLPGCTNRQGFKTKWSLERHQKTVLH
ncbi:hypothetical protein FRC04_007592 [Tulasnella sp. 424]|nr:hypothetical protein FRC04_007592 [Tulasnella sp. 424]KAG8979025.1 hypothetical protein FRC05_009235 [Tulasnella sp. 425]